MSRPSAPSSATVSLDADPLRAIAATAKLGLWDWDILTNDVKWSDAVYVIHGVERATFVVTLDSFTALVHPDDLPRVQAAIRDSLATDAPYELEFRINRPDGSIAWVFTNGAVVRQDGKPVRMIGATLDITSSRHADEAALRLAAIVESSDDAILSKDLSGIITSWNATAEQMFGYSAGEVIGQPITILIPPQRQNEEPGILHRIRQGERIEHYETVRQRKDGSLIDVALTVSPIKDRTGKIVGASKIVRNITAHKFALEQLRLSEERFRLLASHAPVGIFLSDQNGRCVFVNERWSAMSGLSSAEAMGEGWAGAIHPDDRTIVLAGWQEAVRASGPSNSEFRFLRPDGTVVWVQGSAVQFKDGERFRGYLGSCVDVTARKQAELQTAFLHRLTDAVAELTDPEAIIATAQHALGTHVKADRCYFFEMNSADHTATVRSDWHTPGQDSIAGTYRLQDLGAPEYLAFLAQPQAAIADVRVHPVTRDTSARLEQLSIRALAVSTLTKGGRRMTSTALTSRVPRQWTPDELSLLEEVTARIWPIIERAQSVQQLRASEQLHRAVGESINYGIWVCDAQGRSTYQSDSFLKLLGVTPEQAGSFDWMTALHPDDVAETKRAWQECVATGKFWEREHRFKGVDGRWHPILARGVPIRDESGQVTQWIGINLDIAAYKHSQTVARQRMETMEKLNVVGNQLVAEHEIGTIVELVTNAARDISGAAFGGFFSPAPEEAGESSTLAAFSRALRDPDLDFPLPRSSELFASVFRGDGAIRVADLTADPRHGQNTSPGIRSYLAVPVKSRTGEALGGLFFGHPEASVFTEETETALVSLASQAAIAIDNARLYAALQRELVEQKRNETMLRESETRWRQLAEAMPHLVWTCRSDGECDYLSPQWVAYTGVPELDQLGDGWLDFVHPDDRDALVAKWTEVVRNGDVFDTEFRIRRADGRYRSFKTRAVPVRDGEDRIVKWYGTNTDIEEFRRIEQAIRKSEHQLRFVTDHAPVFLVQCDLNHRYRFVNRPYAERYGATREQLIGRHVSEFTGLAAYETFKMHMDACLAGRRVEFEQEIPYTTLGARWVHVIYEPERGPEGDVIGLVAVIVDVTARKQVEFELAKARDEALAASRAKDDFLATLSHELRTPLSPVLLIASDAANNPSLPRDIRDSFELIRTNVSLEARLIDDLLDLTRITRGKMPLEKHLLDIHDVLRDAIANIRQDISAKEIELDLKLSAERSTIMGDPVRLQQVIWNLLKNAVKFTPAGGRIGILTEYAGEPDRMTIEVSDTGIGMSPTELVRVFEAFMQGEHASATGGSQRFGGLGLGLAISQKLVELHGGRIYATSAGRNRGSIFVIELPITIPPRPGDQPAAAAPGSAAAPEPASPSTGSILLVEDHPSTRETLQKLLTRRNFEVVAAGSIAEARAISATRTFDFLVSDVGLPDGDGYQLMSELRVHQPTIQGIAISGYGMEDDLQRSHSAGFAVHLVKPVGITALERALAGLVRPGAAAPL